MTRTLVTIGTDGSRDYVKLPDGQLFTLGSVSILKLVTELAPNARSARQALDDFLENGESLLNINLGELDALIKRPRVRWSSDETFEKIASREGTLMDTELFEAQLNKVERHLAVLTAARISSEVDTGHVARLASCVEVLVGSKSAALDSNEVLASKVLKTIEVIAQEVDKAESEGKPVDASLVRRDLHKIASQVSTIVAGDLEGSLNQLSALETEVNTIQGYFVDSV